MSFVLIESDWNLKEHRGSGKDKEVLRINRIRLEFKVHPVNVSDSSAVKVLIESDWNLKMIIRPYCIVRTSVLIESDWNLKEGRCTGR